jgi:5-formyltetrahydrofolate cyclo-ligase
MRATRQAVPASAVARRSRKIVEALLGAERVARAGGVALFWPMAFKGEVDLRALDAELRARGKRLYYPFMDPGDEPGAYATGFRRVDRVQDLEERGRGFEEPKPSSPSAAPGDVDVVVVPCLAVTPQGDRLGYGSGFYDATLPDVRPPAVAVAVAFSFQLVMELPRRDHDVACDAVVTDEHLFDESGLLQSSERSPPERS